MLCKARSSGHRTHLRFSMRPLASLIRKIHASTINTTLLSAVRTSVGPQGHELCHLLPSRRNNISRELSTSSQSEPEDKDGSGKVSDSTADQVAQTSPLVDTPVAASPIEPSSSETQPAATSSQSAADSPDPVEPSASQPSASGLLGSAVGAYTVPIRVAHAPKIQAAKLAGVMNALFGRQASGSPSLSSVFSRSPPSTLDALFKGLTDPSKPTSDSSSLPNPPSLDVGDLGSSGIVLGRDPTDTSPQDSQSVTSSTSTTSASGDAAIGSESSEAGDGLSSSSSDDETAEEEEGKHRALLHPKFGFAVLGGVNPTGKAGFKSSLAKTLASEHPRVATKRKFVPGQTYEPQDLNENAPLTSARTSQARLLPAHADVMVYADYKNVAFLDNFLSPAGRLVPRKDTKLPLYLHKEVMSQIKLARNLGLIAGEARLDKMHLKKARAAAAKAYMEKVGQEQQLEHL